MLAAVAETDVDDAPMICMGDSSCFTPTAAAAGVAAGAGVTGGGCSLSTVIFNILFTLHFHKNNQTQIKKDDMVTSGMSMRSFGKRSCLEMGRSLK